MALVLSLVEAQQEGRRRKLFLSIKKWQGNLSPLNFVSESFNVESLQ